MAKSIALNRAIERASCCVLCRPIANKLKLRSTPLFNSNSPKKSEKLDVGAGCGGGRARLDKLTPGRGERYPQLPCGGEFSQHHHVAVLDGIRGFGSV